MTKVLVLLSLIITIPAFATDPDPVAQKTVASKAYVDTKQDIIETELVDYHDAEEDFDYTVPALVSYGTGTNNADGVLGNKIGILGLYENVGGLGSWEFLNLWDDSEAAYLDNFVPTVRAVATKLDGIESSLTNIWDNMPSHWTALTWDSAETTSTNAYDITFVGDTGATANAWPSADKTKLINTAALAQGLALKQNKIPAKSTGNTAPKGNQAIVLDAAGYPSNVYTTAGKDLALTAKSGAQKVMNYVDGTTASATFATSQGLTEAQVKSALVSLELLKDVYSELNTKITNNALPTGTTGTVVTYNGTNATTGVQEFGERAVYDPANTYNASTDATKLATMASVKYVCGGYEPAAAGQPAHDGTHPGDEDYCWLWVLPN